MNDDDDNITYIRNAITNIQTALNDDFTYNEDNNDARILTSIDESYEYFNIEDIEDSRGIYTTIDSYTNQYIPAIRHDSCSTITKIITWIRTLLQGYYLACVVNNTIDEGFV